MRNRCCRTLVNYNTLTLKTSIIFKLSCKNLLEYYDGIESFSIVYIQSNETLIYNRYKNSPQNYIIPMQKERRNIFHFPPYKCI